MKGIKRIVATVVCGALLCSTVAFSACSGNSAADVQRHMVTYELNYDGAEEAREMSVAEGRKATQWRAYRDGYELEGWYTDSACTQPYDFTQGVTGDCTLYANWTVKKGYVELKFDYDYIGRINKTVSVKSNQTIPEKAIPLADDRVGMKFEGWYSDREKTQKWDMETDVIIENTTLYANYEIDPSWVIRNNDGTVKYEDVQIEVCFREGSYTAGDYNVFCELVNEFNAQHVGEITATAAKFDWDNDNNSFFILDRTLSMEANRYYWSFYYNAADIFTAAGVELDMSAFYENGIRDVFVDGIMLGYPIAAQTPYLLYSKALMTKYWSCIGNRLPTNYTEFTKLMRAAYEGESVTNTNFKTILQWDGDFNYLPCTIPFVQNGAEFYRVEGADRVCDWAESATADKAMTALNNYYDVLGKNGTCHGTAYGSNRLGNLNSNNALFAVISLSSGANETAVAANSETIGVMSMAGLFSDDAENANKVPILPVSVGFWKDAVAVTPTQMCASAEFAKFLADNAYRFADTGLVPLNKSAYAKFAQETGANAKILQNAITPENFYTCDGSSRDWVVRRDVVSPAVLTYLNGEGTNTDSTFQQLFRKILGKIG